MTRLEKIKARWKAVTPGPWGYDDGQVSAKNLVNERFARVKRKLSGEDVSTEMNPEEKICWVNPDNPRMDAIEIAIAKAPEDIAWLIMEVEDLRG